MDSKIIIFLTLLLFFNDCAVVVTQPSSEYNPLSLAAAITPAKEATCQMVLDYLRAQNLTLQDYGLDKDLLMEPEAASVQSLPLTDSNNNGSIPGRMWMTNLPEKVRNLPLTHVAIPGSHESFTFDLDTSALAEFAPDVGQQMDWANNGFIKVVSLITGTRAAALAIVKRWSKTQDHDFYAQLNGGIRYFDVRVAYDERSRKIRAVHGLYGPVVFYQLDVLGTFFEQAPSEVVILHFSRFYAMPVEQHRSLVNYLTHKFAKKLVSAKAFGNNPNLLTLARLAASNQQLIVYYEDPLGPSLSDGAFWTWSTIDNPWPETTDDRNLTSFLQRHFEMRHHELPANFQVFQGVFTPDKSYIGRRLGVVGGLKELSLKATEAFVKWLDQARSSQGALPGKLNICAVDFANQFDYAAHVVGMNY